MANKYVEQRLRGLLASLNAMSVTTMSSASASKGAARSNFINKFLIEVMPPELRIATNGEITDPEGNKSGELDIIIENGLFPSLPAMGTDASRLYFSEGAAAVIEVKSDLAHQWDEVLETGRKLSVVGRDINGGIMMGRSGLIFQSPLEVENPDEFPLFSFDDNSLDSITTKVPYFVVGYHGWTKPSTVEQKLTDSAGIISGILQLDIEHFCSSNSFNNLRVTGPFSLLAFINAIHEASSYIKASDSDFMRYATD